MFTSIYDTDNQREKINSVQACINPNNQPVAASNTISAGSTLPTTPQSGSGFGNFASNYGGMIGQGIGATTSMLPKKNEFNNGAYRDSVQQKEDAREKTVGTIKDTVASVFGPYGLLFRGIEKGGNALGDSIGGDTGNYISSFFSPVEAIMAANSDPDIKTGDKILGTILPFHAAKMSKKAKEARKTEFERLQRINERIAKQRTREADQRMAEGLEQIEDLRNLKKQQLGLTVKY